MKEIVAQRKPKLLLVEDDRDLRLGLADYLRLREFDVTEASSGAEFRGVLAENSFDVAILDVNLPDVNGFDLAASLAERKDIGVIMLTALCTREDKLRGYSSGADLYFTKPVDSEELASAASNLVKRVRRDGSAALPPSRSSSRSSNWLLDRKRQRLVAPDGTGIQLSGKETVLMEFFAQHDSRTISRMDVLQFYDPAPGDPFSRRFDVAFGRLRAKAKEVDMDLPVQIIRGSGVRLLDKIDVL